MTDLERADALLYALLMEDDDAPRQEAMLARALAAARREGYEEAAKEYVEARRQVYESGAEEMRERAAREARYWTASQKVADRILALPLTRWERTHD